MEYANNYRKLLQYAAAWTMEMRSHEWSRAWKSNKSGTKKYADIYS